LATLRANENSDDNDDEEKEEDKLSIHMFFDIEAM